MAETVKDYSHFIQHLSNQFGGLITLAGFTLTVITLLLIRLPSSEWTPQSQIVLIFLTFLFYLIIFLVQHLALVVLRNCESVPPWSLETAVCNILFTVVILMLGLALPLVYLIFNLTLLSEVSGIMWLIFVIIGYFTLWKPAQKARKRAI